MTEIKSYFAPGSDGLLVPLKPWLEDKEVSELIINQAHEVFIERLGEMHRFEVPELNPLHLKRLFSLLANENGQVLNEANPLLSGNLKDGSRVQLVIPPAAKNFTLSIRRQSIASQTLSGYSGTPFYSQAKPFQLDETQTFAESDKELLALYHKQYWAHFIAEAVKAKKTIVISGETSSGKTTFLNACCQEIPLSERLITLEDTLEVNLPHPNKVALLAAKRGESVKVPLTMQDLVQCALRLRPERIIMGEIRGREILDFVSACATGHEGSITTIHASNPQIAFMRMAQLYKLNNVPSMRDEDILRELKAVIDIIIQLKKTPHGRAITWVYFKQAARH